MTEYDKQQNVTRTAERMGVDRKTVRKYVRDDDPQKGSRARHWRTRADPFEVDANFITERLKADPGIEAGTLLQLLEQHRPVHYHQGQLRTLQRRMRQHRALVGPEKEVFFSQVHRPGEALQTDFTHGDKLGVHIDGAPFSHLLCHCVLPYSNWDFATVCQSESLIALTRGISSAVHTLGVVPLRSQTDNSTSATHCLRRTGKKRGFNKSYEDFCAHYGMTPSVIGVGKKEQNGDVESANRHLKRRISQALIVRGNTDFDSVLQYERFVQNVCSSTQRPKFIDEQTSMRALRATPWPEYRSYDVRVGRGSTIRVLANTYSVPSRLIGHSLEVRVSEYQLQAYFDGKLQMHTPRLVGKYDASVDYRHLVSSLVQKPGAFERYRFREQMFPSVLFRRAYDQLLADHGPGRKADHVYLRILNLAATTSESEVEHALELLLAPGRVQPAPCLSLDAVKALCPSVVPATPNVAPVIVDLGSYDALLGACA